MTSPYLLGIRLVAVLVSAGLVVSCATGKALQKGESSAIAGDWDSAVEHYRRAVQEEPRNADYRVALQRAMLNASRVHLTLSLIHI